MCIPGLPHLFFSFHLWAMIWHNSLKQKNPAHPAVSLFRVTGQNTNRESRSQQVGSYLIMHKSFFARGPSKVAEFHRECGMWKPMVLNKTSSACWKSKATTRCEFVLQLQLVFEVALTVPWLYENGNLSVFRMWAHQKGPI